MKRRISTTEEYLANLDKQLGAFVQCPTPSLPLILRERYNLFTVRLFGKNWTLAIEQDGWDTGTPTEYQNHWHQLRQAVAEKNVAVVLPQLTATTRSRMIAAGVPFVVPGTQVFLPDSLVLLTESFQNSIPHEGKPLSPVGQVLVLYELLEGGIEKLSSKKLSDRLKYSRASISNAVSELLECRLCDTYRDGKEQHIHFMASGAILWETALPLLRSPVTKRKFVRREKPLHDMKSAGLSALANRTDIADDPVPVFATSEKNLRDYLETGQLTGCSDRYEADAEIEVWRYAPDTLSKEPDVDPLSLFLTLCKSPDERVQAGLTKMIARFGWQ